MALRSTSCFYPKNTAICTDPKSPSARASSTELPGKRCARCLSEASLRVPPADRATQRTRRAVQLGWPRGCRGKWPCISPCSPSGRKADQNNHRRCWVENDRSGSWGRASRANQLRINSESTAPPTPEPEPSTPPHPTHKHPHSQ